MTSNSIYVKYFDIEGEHHNQVTSWRSYLFHLTHVTHLVILFKRNKSSKSSITLLYFFSIFFFSRVRPNIFEAKSISKACCCQVFCRQNLTNKNILIRFVHFWQNTWQQHKSRSNFLVTLLKSLEFNIYLPLAVYLSIVTWWNGFESPYSYTLAMFL